MSAVNGGVTKLTVLESLASPAISTGLYRRRSNDATGDPIRDFIPRQEKGRFLELEQPRARLTYSASPMSTDSVEDILQADSMVTVVPPIGVTGPLMLTMSTGQTVSRGSAQQSRGGPKNIRRRHRFEVTS